MRENDVISQSEVDRLDARRATTIVRLLERQPWDLLVPHLEKAGADPQVALPRLRRYAELLLEWNRGRSNLISANDEGRILRRHILESVEPAHWLRSSGARRWMDLGSGGGLPAIPLIIAGVGDDWVLVESRRNKTLFLRKVIQEMELRGVDVRLARLESLAGSDGLGLFDGFTSRATMRLGPTLTMAGRWVVDGGSAFLWKGTRRDEEISQDRSWEASWELIGHEVLGEGPTVVERFIKKTV